MQSRRRPAPFRILACTGCWRMGNDAGRSASPPRMRAMLSRGLLLLVLLMACALPVQARTVYRCLRDGTVSLATAAEPGSKCEAKQIEDHPAKVTNIWGDLGVIHGTLYEWESDGRTIYTTRKLPGAKPYLKFTA